MKKMSDFVMIFSTILFLLLLLLLLLRLLLLPLLLLLLLLLLIVIVVAGVAVNAIGVVEAPIARMEVPILASPTSS